TIVAMHHPPIPSVLDLAVSVELHDQAPLAGIWGPDAAAALHRGNRVPALRAIEQLRGHLSALPPVAVLADLFMLGHPVQRAELERALPSLG
ncbi:hypothetical protein ACC691_38665, partial [Rhizobium johnstonii]|uniref:DUF7059 domain-containing protein n=1 Tax=Rhizobium johnstonii TaxID=3019933 RepID=UPI003F94D002